MKRFIYMSVMFPVNIYRVCIGLWHFKREGSTPPSSYQAMIQLFCFTSGWSRDFLAWCTGRFYKPYEFSRRDMKNSVLQESSDSVAKDLKENGFHVFEQRLPEDMCDRLLTFATSRPFKVRMMDEEVKIASNNDGYKADAIYDPAAPQANRYDAKDSDLINNADVQRLMADMSFVSVAQDYLGVAPVLDVVSMWWHTSFSSIPDKEAAQYFHFDMDRIKWLKFFIYLTDVDTNTGPHTFIRGSHRRGGIPLALRSAGYARLTDEEVSRHYNDNDFIEFNAPRGTIIAEDTSGLHKGKHVLKGDRLLLQLQFSVSLFGTTYSAESSADLNRVENTKLLSVMKDCPRVFSRYTGKVWK